MKTAGALMVAIAIGAPAMAQQPNPLTAGATQHYGIIKGYVTRTAAKIPEEIYPFRPAPEVRTIAQLIGHLADANYRLCSIIGGQNPPIEAGIEPELEPFVAKGRELFMQRQGQLNLGCTNCHDDNWDKRLAGSAITQAHPTGYPLYRLEWQSMGSLQRRLRACITGIRAQAYDYGAPELVELELYLMSRARSMPVETPAVRP